MLDDRLKYFKLLNGEDIIGIVVDETSDLLTIAEPVAITTFRMDGTSDLIFDMSPWTFHANTDIICLQRDQFIGPFPTKPYLQEQYAYFVKAEKQKDAFLDQNKDQRREAIEVFATNLGVSRKIN